jgi:uncharacterized SAM-binding protein YcdF (DUF218 family)
MLVRLGPEVQEVSRALSPATPRARRRVRDLLLVGLAAGIGAVMVTGYATYRIWTEGGRDEARPASAIVVLGAAQYNGRPSPVFAARLDHAIDLFERGYAPLLVVTGGKQTGDRWTEAEAARRYAIAKGVPASAIAQETKGRTTLESLDGVAALLARRGVSDAIFVSDPTHILRVLRIARDVGLTGYGSPTRTSPVDRDATSRAEATLHELGALAIYFVARSAPPGELAAARAVEPTDTTGAPGSQTVAAPMPKTP